MCRMQSFVSPGSVPCDPSVSSVSSVPSAPPGSSVLTERRRVPRDGRAQMRYDGPVYWHESADERRMAVLERWGVRFAVGVWVVVVVMWVAIIVMRSGRV